MVFQFTESYICVDHIYYYPRIDAKMPLLLNLVRWACVIAYCNIANYAFFWYDERDARKSSSPRIGDMEFAPRLFDETNGVNPRSFTRTSDMKFAPRLTD